MSRFCKQFTFYFPVAERSVRSVEAWRDNPKMSIATSSHAAQPHPQNLKGRSSYRGTAAKAVVDYLRRKWRRISLYVLPTRIDPKCLLLTRIDSRIVLPIPYPLSSCLLDFSSESAVSIRTNYVHSPTHQHHLASSSWPSPLARQP